MTYPSEYQSLLLSVFRRVRTSSDTLPADKIAKEFSITVTEAKIALCDLHERGLVGSVRHHDGVIYYYPVTFRVQSYPQFLSRGKSAWTVETDDGDIICWCRTFVEAAAIAGALNS